MIGKDGTWNMHIRSSSTFIGGNRRYVSDQIFRVVTAIHTFWLRAENLLSIELVSLPNSGIFYY